MKVFVLGGRGFIGRHVVAALGERGAEVVVGSRGGRRNGAVEVRLERLLDAAAWHPLLDDVAVVVNCVGILRERGGESYDAIQHRAPRALAVACAARHVRLVHVSALGLDGARHPFMTSKAAGDTAVLDACPDAVVVRPSLLDGRGGYGARWIRAMARLPVHVVPAQATGSIAALDVEDLGQAIARLCVAPSSEWHGVVELGGPNPRTFAAHLAALRRETTARPAWRITLPAPLARSAARVCDLLHVSPYSAGHLELLTRANTPAVDRLSTLLGRRPRDVGRTASPTFPSGRRAGVAG